MKLSKLWLQPPRQFKNRIRVGDIAPDGVKVEVDWDKFEPGTSIFIPCVNTVECVRQVFELSRIKDWSLDIRFVIEGGRWGVRFWRIL